MVKIIERKERKIPHFRFSCNFCESILECDENDFDFPMSLGRATVLCPVCHQRTSVREEDKIYKE